MSREIIKVKFIGKDNPISLRNGKEYEAVVGQRGLFCIVDESGEEYAYNPKLFEVIEYIR